MSYRIGVLGGMFDPVHNGHVEAARCALRKLALDELRMIPCQTPNHRRPAKIGPQHRLHMIELAIRNEPGIRVDPIEIDRTGISYMVDTLAILKTNAGDCALVLVLGVDSFNTIPQWHRWHQLLELCHFLVLARPGIMISEDVIAAPEFEHSLVASTEELFHTDSGRIMVLDDFSFDISSTKVRKLLAMNIDMSAMLDENVIDYIRSNNLYAK
ncbi:MAG TPA: nicotinate-nicotinamide nucleotide adenylyltransferase [Gammaproteobacteria bacterium]|nr:nicotinate-nicotinamide nucleotide adenylyltransferase [Gammaproteobacteria bacterium]